MSTSTARGPRLRIVAINDVYQLDNFPRLATLIAELGRTDPVDRTLVTLAGDFLAPSLLSSLDQGAGMVEVLNAIGVTHVTFGNHEDDIEVAALRQRLSELNALWLDTNAPEFSPACRTHDIVSVHAPAGHDEVRVGLIGVVVDDPTIYRRPPFGGTRLLPARETARTVATALVHDGVADLVVPLTHLPLAEDRLLAKEQRTPPFRIILGGHDHAEVLEWVAQTGITLVATTPDTDLLYSQVDLTSPVAVAVGSEKHGLTRAVLDAADHVVRLPMAGRADSLNVSVSAAVVLYEAVRQRLEGGQEHT